MSDIDNPSEHVRWFGLEPPVQVLQTGPSGQTAAKQPKRPQRAQVRLCQRSNRSGVR